MTIDNSAGTGLVADEIPKNTDRLDVGSSTNVAIGHTVVRGQDDYVAVNSGMEICLFFVTSYSNCHHNWDIFLQNG